MSAARATRSPSAGLALAALAARRTAPFLAGALVALALAIALDARVEPPGLAWLAEPETRAAAGALRARTFATGGVVLTVALALALERLVARRAAGEEAVRRAAPIARATAVVADFAGWLAVAAVGLALAALVAELRAPGAAPWRRAATLELEPVVLGGADDRALVALDAFAAAVAGDRVSVEVFALPGTGGVAAVALGLRRAGAGDAAWVRVERRFDARAIAELEVPGGAGPLELALVRAPAGPPVGIGRDGIAWIAADAGSLRAVVALAAHAGAVLALAGALALALARAVRPGLAVALAATAALATVVLRAPIAGGGLRAAWAELGLGLAPATPAPVGWLALAVLVALLLIAARGTPAQPGRGA